MSTRPYEELERELESIVTRLERGELPLDEAIELWERGEELHRLCLERLRDVEQRVEELSGSPAPSAG